MTGASRVRAGVLSVLLCASVAGGFALHRTNEPDTSKFCEPALPIRVIDGRTLAVQTDDPDGTSHCDVGETTPGMETLGTDCKVRSPDGSVVDAVTASRADGKCGLDSPGP